MVSKAKLQELDERVVIATELIKQHGPLSCAEIARKMGISSTSTAYTLRRMVKAGTHARVETNKRDSCKNPVMAYVESDNAWKCSEVREKPTPRRSLVTDARKLIVDSGIRENISSVWLSQNGKMSTSQASATLALLAGYGVLEKSEMRIIKGRKQRFYSVNEQALVDDEIKKQNIAQATLNLWDAMKGFIAAERRFFPTRGFLCGD